MRLRFHLTIHVVLAMAFAPGVAVAQTFAWQVFSDVTGETCEVVHTANADLVVLSSTGQLVIVTGQDITLQDTAVDTSGFVFFEGAESGLISFQPDGAGVRTLWWTSLTGRIINVDELTGEPTVSEFFPEEITGVSCAACDFWDDQTVCADGGDDVVDDDESPPLLTITVCGVSTPIAFAAMFMGLASIRLVRRRSA
jgi:hypothetical protein